MAHECHPNCENRIRLDAAVTQLEVSTSLLLKSIFSGSDDAIELAYSAVRVAKVKFTSARAICREQCPVCDLEISGLAAK